MSGFYTSLVRPSFPALSVALLVSSGGARWQLAAAAGIGLYLTFLEIGRQGGWK